MARTLAFDRDQVVRAAREVFWQNGYEGTSLPEIEEATSLSRSSIYNSFGSKRGLFDAAVQSYLNEVIRPRLRPLRTEPVSPDAILDYLQGLRDVFGQAGGLPGCMLVNTANSPLGTDSALTGVITSYRNELHEALQRGIGAHLPALDVAGLGRLTDAVCDLVIAAFALVRVSPALATRTLTTATVLVESGT